MKMKIVPIFFLLHSFSFSQHDSGEEHQYPLISRIAFGSCGHQDRPQPVLSLAASRKPDVFVFLGDNIYGDTNRMKVLKQKYRKLGDKPEFRQLWEASRVIATWDDHDYGRNDAGKEYRHKEQSKNIFLDFWKVPPEDIRHHRKGIYTSYFFEGNSRTVQIILLDLRTFRDDLRPYRNEPVDKNLFHYKLDYWPHETTRPTMLGEEQWNWLKEQLLLPADVRIIASSTQFGITWNGYEAWANFPHEQKKMLSLIKETKASGVIFISGDVHYAEISRVKEEGLYPVYDITASGITSTWDFATPNGNRVDGPVMENHFGMIEIEWHQADPVLTLQIIDVSGQLKIERKIPLSSLRL